MVCGDYLNYQAYFTILNKYNTNVDNFIHVLQLSFIKQFKYSFRAI